MASITFSIYLFLFISSIFLTTEARPLNGIDGFFNVLSLMGGMKNSGPSPGGQGHDYVNAQTLGGIKDSGPSPGAGHHFTNSQTLGGIKNSGHQFTDVSTLGGIKPSGPSPGGKGHDYTTVHNLGGIKESMHIHCDDDGHSSSINIDLFAGIKAGPSPGEGHSYVTGAHQ